MKKIGLKYGRNKLYCEINKDHIIHTLMPKDTEHIKEIKNEVTKVLNNPTGTKPLKDIVKSGEKVAIIVSDITRAWMKSNEFIIHIVDYLSNLGVGDDDIFVVIALGGHRKSTKEEMIAIVGEEVYSRINVYNHECEDDNELVYVGESRVKTPIYLNKRVSEADRVIITGGIVFHLMAGFGGGAKSILPGVVGLKTIQANHRLCFNEGLSSGVNLEVKSNNVNGNPVREDMNDVCGIVSPDFLFNVVLDTSGNFIKFVAGHYKEAWLEGCEYIRSLYGVPIQSEADIVVASAGGYPKDINLYQTVKTVDNGLYGGRDNSVLILISECSEGLGADEFADWFRFENLEDIENELKNKFTVPGYVAYKLSYTIKNRKVILVSLLDKDLVRSFDMIPCDSLEEAIKVAYNICDCDEPKITLMPHGGNTLPISL